MESPAPADLPVTAPAPADLPVTAPAEKEKWECCVCYEDGKRTGQITLSCGHPLCLGCFVQHQQDQVRTGRPCPMCRRTIRLTDGITEQEKNQLAQLARMVNRAKDDVERYELAVASAKRQGLATTTQLMTLMRSLGMSDDDLPGLLAQNPHDQPQPRSAPAPPRADALATLQRTTPAPPIPATATAPPAPAPAPAGETVRCAGCRTQKPAGSLRFYHMPGVHAGETRRLKRCEGCHTREWNAYRTRTRNTVAMNASPNAYRENADVPV